jgi:hypothetical protein
LVANARDANGHPNYEAHKVTRLYEEIVQAEQGSRWVWVLTFASSIEGMVRMLIRKDVEPSDSEADAIAALVRHIQAGPEPVRLKAIAINAVHRTAAITPIRALRELKSCGVIMGVQLKAWEDVRDAVMHGSLISPYSSADFDAKLLTLASLLHTLTREILRRAMLPP